MSGSLSPEQQRLVVRGRAVAAEEAQRAANKYRWASQVVDLEAEAERGLVEAALTFDPNRNDSFRGFCRFRVRGAVLDAIAKEAAAVSRPRLAIERAGAELATAQHTRAWEDPEAAPEDHLNNYVASLAGAMAMRYVASVDNVLDAPAAARMDNARAREAIEKVMQKLLPKERRIVTLFAWDDTSVREVARQMGMPLASCQRFLSATLRRLRELMAAEGVTEPPRPWGDIG